MIRVNSPFVTLRHIRYEQHDYYYPHPKDEEGLFVVLTRVCLFTEGVPLVPSRGVPPSPVTGPLPQTGHGSTTRTQQGCSSPTGYAACGMPLAGVQEDFLVLIFKIYI